jgi:hypothetical protein
MYRYAEAVDPRALTSDKIHRAQLNAPLVGASLPVLGLFLRESVVAVAPAVGAVQVESTSPIA